jgi:N-acetyl-gamma-glutamyl-phosphate reductase
VSTSVGVVAPEAGRRPGPREDAPRLRVAIVGATGYVGGELIRLLSGHPNVEIVGLVGRERADVPVGQIHPHLGSSSLVVDDEAPNGDVDVVFFALPHGVAAGAARGWLDRGASIVDLGPDFRLRDPADYPRWYNLEHPAPQLLARAVYGLPELHRAELAALHGENPSIVGAPGCYPTATILALAPLARAGLIGDLVVDAKSGVSGAGREAKAELVYGEVNENVRAYGVGGHRHVAEIEQELDWLGARLGAAAGGNAGPDGSVSGAVDFLPHLVPMTRGILASCHIRTTRPVVQVELDDLYAATYAGEPFIQVVADPPSTKHVLGSNHCRVFVHHDARTGRVLALAVIDNLVKGAAGQAVQAFNVVHGLPETAGLGQLPLAP